MVTSCIDNEIGFVFKPVFSKNQMDLFLNKNHKYSISNVIAKQEMLLKDAVEKTITANDIRARIVSIPSSIIKQISDEINSIDVLVNNDKIQVYYC